MKNVTTVYVGEEVRFHCLATGSQGILIIWSKDEKPVSDELIKEVPSGGGIKSILKIRKAKRADAGIYVCIASDAASHVINASGRLVVKGMLVK